MSGIYIHIPFCKQACVYCNFHFSTTLNSFDDLVNALCKELVLRSNYLTSKKLDSIYFGGGTPSLLKEKHLLKIFGVIQEHFTINNEAEITLEANPDDISETWLNGLKKTPVNRLSIGIQSFFDEDLIFMNRAHLAKDAKKSLNLIKSFDYQNISLDLIYGFDGLTTEKWKENIQTAIDFGAKHISSYALTVEPKTALSSYIKNGKLPELSDEKAAAHFEILVETLQANGYLHYEISNFAKDGFIAKHNSSYWKGKAYLGIGPSAHSFNKKTRSWNIANNQAYIASINKNELNFTEEVLTKNDLLNEYIMTGLRTIWGCDLDFILKTFGVEQKDRIIKKSALYIEKNLLHMENNALKTTQKGKFLADGIASDLFII